MNQVLVHKTWCDVSGKTAALTVEAFVGKDAFAQGARRIQCYYSTLGAHLEPESEVWLEP